MTTPEPRRQLGWLDSTSIIVGTIIGAGIFQTAPQVASSVGSVWGLLGLWLVGGVLSLCGAMCYAELASAFPRTGGDYVYLKEAYGDWAGFLFGWLQMLVIRPGDIAIIAFIFGTYFQTLVGYDKSVVGDWSGWFAAMAVAIFTAINVLGVRQTKWMQNLLTTLKVLGLLGIVAVGLTSAPPASISPASLEPTSSIPIGVALILVLFTYGGWNEMAYVGAEVKHPERNLVRSLISGTIVVTLLYLLMNVAFVNALGLEEMSRSNAIATDTIARRFPRFGETLVSLLICVSTLGTVNGMILTGSRISFALGAEHRPFRALGRWSPRTETPMIALLFQGAMTLLLIVLLQSFTSAVLYTSSAVYMFYFATSLAVFVLRIRRPAMSRPYRVTAYPIPMLIFSSTCLYLVYSTVVYKPEMALFIGILAAVGVGIYFWQRSLLRTESKST